MADIFISYTSEDRATVEALANAFEQEGWSTWWDRNIGAGADWQDSIRSALTEAGCIVVVWSVESWKSDWVRAEAEEGFRRKVYLGVRVDDVAIGVPFSRDQTISLGDWSGEQAHPALTSVVEWVRSKLGHDRVSLNQFLDNLRDRANAGNAEAQYEYALRLADGKGVPKDELQAVRYYELAAAQGHAWANCNLGELHYLGTSGKKDIEAAVRCYTFAATAGDTKAQVFLGHLYRSGEGVRKDLRAAFRLYEKSASSGSAGGQANLGMMYENGWGCRRNLRLAYSHYVKASEKGLTSAMVSLGRCYRDAIGVKRDPWEALRFFRMAAENGNVKGQTNLGWALYKGEGCVSNRVEAVKWYRRSAAQGDSWGQNNLGLCLRDGEGCIKDEVAAFEMFKMSADAGFSNGKYNLGVALLEGRGCDPDRHLALKYLTDAARQGHDEAGNKILEHWKWIPLDVNWRLVPKQALQGAILPVLFTVGFGTLVVLHAVAITFELDGGPLLGRCVGALDFMVAKLDNFVAPVVALTGERLGLPISQIWSRTLLLGIAFVLPFVLWGPPKERVNNLVATSSAIVVVSLATGMLGMRGQWWIQGMIAAAPALVFLVLTFIRRRFRMHASSFFVLPALLFTTAAALTLLNIEEAHLLALILTMSYAGLGLLVAGLILPGSLDGKRSSFRAGVGLAGPVLLALAILVLDRFGF